MASTSGTVARRSGRCGSAGRRGRPGGWCRLVPITVAPSPASRRATSAPMPPRPTTSTVISETWRISQRPLQVWSRCWASSRGRSLAPASTPKTANSASGPPCTPAEVVKRIRCSCAATQSGGLDLAAAAGRHGVHPAQLRVGVRRALQGGRVDIGNAVERVGRVEHLLEGPLLLGRPGEPGVAGEVGRMPHRRIERLVADQLDPRLAPLDQLAQLFGKGRGDDDAQSCSASLAYLAGAQVRLLSRKVLGRHRGLLRRGAGPRPARCGDRGAGRRGGGHRAVGPAELRAAAASHQPDQAGRHRAGGEDLAVQLTLFDILHLNGRSLLKRTYANAGDPPRTWCPHAEARGSKCRPSSTTI